METRGETSTLLDEVSSLDVFLTLSRADVEALAKRSLRHVPEGSTWLGLSKVMQRQSLSVVGDLGLPAASAWARHLGVPVAQA
jgi:hypothetical protein